MSGVTGLSKRILFYILICSSSVTLILTLLELYFEYRIDVNLLEQRFKSIEVSYLPSLSENIWLFNTDVVESQIRGIYNLNDVIYVSIVDETNTIVNAIGDKQAKHIISQTYPIIREQQGTINQLGHMEVWATLDNIYASLQNRLAVILLGQGVKTFLVSFLILLIIFKIITSRVSRISQLVSSIDLSDDQKNQRNCPFIKPLRALTVLMMSLTSWPRQLIPCTARFDSSICKVMNSGVNSAPYLKAPMTLF
ncbi:hypothetical protein [Aliamphritea spongicola]|nr:hypothetical protein [Aliamphritea spongicola]